MSNVFPKIFLNQIEVICNAMQGFPVQHLLPVGTIENDGKNYYYYAVTDSTDRSPTVLGRGRQVLRK